VVEQLAMSVTAGGHVYSLMSEMALAMGETPAASFRPELGSRMRLVFLDLLKVSFPLVGYQSEPVSALLAVLSGGRDYWHLSSSGCSATQDVASLALGDPLLLSFYVFNSLNRYPYEFLPFISLYRILASSPFTDDKSDLILGSLLKTPSLTFVLPEGFQDYELAQEEDNTNTIRIVEDIPLFANSSEWKRRLAEEEPFCIPAGTFGRFVSDTGRVVLMEYEHSTLALLGKRLEANLASDAYLLQLGYLGSEEVSEAISLIATLIRVETLKASGAEETGADEAGLAVLREASRALPRTKDLISVVCDTLDTYIQRDMTALDGPDISVITACIAFLHSILPICPGRVWSYMARCALLNTDSRAGRLSRITGTLDLVSERYDFLVSAVTFFSSLVDSAMTSAVQRKVGGKLGGRQKGDESQWLGTSEKILAQVNLSVAQTVVDILENSSTWRFSSEIDRSILIRGVVPIMNKLVLYSFSMGDATDGSNTNPLVACLEPAARYVIQSFLASSSGSLRFQPLLSTLLVAFDMPDSTLYTLRDDVISQRLIGVLEFATSLIRAATYLEQPAAAIETQLLKGGSLVARLCAVDDSFKGPAFALLGALAESAGKANSEPPSLLSYLGPQISRSFIHVLSRLDKPFDRPGEGIRYWQFFSTIIRNRQQWMANCLLTGKTPREALKGDTKSA
jgi:nuclear pore complex protein Nup188